MQQQIDFIMDMSVIKLLEAWRFYYHLDNIFIKIWLNIV